MSKKICYCTTISKTIESFILESAKYIHEHTDWDISFICSYDEPFEKSLPEYIHYYPVNMKRGISFDGLKAILKMHKIFKREKFDLVQYSTPNAALYASLAAKWARIPVRLYCQWGMVFVAFSGFKRGVFKFIEKLICRNSTRIEPDSKGNLLFARQQGLYDDAKSSVVWNGSACGINLDKFDIGKKSDYRKAIREKYKIPDDAFVYIFVGRINKDKGINELLEAYLNLLKKHTVHLFVLGAYENDKYVSGELYSRSLREKRIIYTGNVHNVEEYLAASDCYVLPSYREGFGMGVIEAQAMGLPVIVTDIPGPTDVVSEEQTGIIVPKQDADKLKDAMELLYNNPDMCIRYGKQGYSVAREKFEQRTMFEHIVNDRKRLLDLN